MHTGLIEELATVVASFCDTFESASSTTFVTVTFRFTPKLVETVSAVEKLMICAIVMSPTSQVNNSTCRFVVKLTLVVKRILHVFADTPYMGRDPGFLGCDRHT